MEIVVRYWIDYESWEDEKDCYDEEPCETWWELMKQHRKALAVGRLSDSVREWLDHRGLPDAKLTVFEETLGCNPVIVSVVPEDALTKEDVEQLEDVAYDAFVVLEDEGYELLLEAQRVDEEHDRVCTACHRE